MTITIPEWILWVLGIPLCVILLAFAALCIYFFVSVDKRVLE